MLSYMLPVEEKTSPPRNLNLNLNLNMTAASESMGSSNLNGNSGETCDENTKLLPSERAYNHKSSFTRDQKLDNNAKQNGKDESSNASGEDGDDSKNLSKKGKLTKIGNKNVTLKRVSFGSSKGSMVETLVFETPTPLPEHAEREFGYGQDLTVTTTLPGESKMVTNNNLNNNNNNNTSLDDSGIELQEELERSKVRVTFFQSSKPQQISPPESFSHYSDSIFPLLSESFLTEGTTNNERMTATTAQPPNYDRQMSTESGWDNPFRPGGDLSREADEIVNMIKGGKPITPTSEANQLIANGSAQKDTGNHSVENGAAIKDGATKVEASQVQSAPAQNGTKSPLTKTTGGKANGDAKPSQTQVSNQVIPGPTSASHVVIEDKKKKKCTCCVIQ